jgi:hypothetical protein
MPHDRNGKPVTKGDVVTMTFGVLDVQQGEKDCNCTLQAIPPAGFDGTYLPIVACNTGLIGKIDPTPRAVPGV